MNVGVIDMLALRDVVSATSPGIPALPAVDISQSSILRSDEVVIGVAQAVDSANKIARDKLRRSDVADGHFLLVVGDARDAGAELVVLFILIINCTDTL